MSSELTPSWHAFVLQNVHLDEPRWLHPVEERIVEVRIGSHDAGKSLGGEADLGDVGPADPILHRASNRRADL